MYPIATSLNKDIEIEPYYVFITYILSYKYDKRIYAIILNLYLKLVHTNFKM